MALQYLEALKALGASAGTKFIIPAELTAFAAPFAAWASGRDEDGRPRTGG